jgi:hypothetical protein
MFLDRKVDRKGTYSLKLALDQLGQGPCHHMEEVIHNQSIQVPTSAIDPDFDPNRTLGSTRCGHPLARLVCLSGGLWIL